MKKLISLLFIAITLNCFATSWTPYFTGFTTAPVVNESEYYISDTSGLLVTAVLNMTATASNLTSFSVTIPFPAAYEMRHIVWVSNASAWKSTPGLMIIRARSNIADVYLQNENSGTNGNFTASGTKSVMFTITYERMSVEKPTQIFFLGNSLMNDDLNRSGSGWNGYYVPIKAYKTIKNSIDNVNYDVWASSGKSTKYMVDNWSTIKTGIDSGAVVIFMEGTNYLFQNDTSTANGAYQYALMLRDSVYSCNAKFIICTTSSRDVTGDPANLLQKIWDYNSLITSDTTKFDAVVRIGEDAMFDTRADCSVTGNYKSDKLHWVSGGQDRSALLMANRAIAYLNQ